MPKQISIVLLGLILFISYTSCISRKNEGIDKINDSLEESTKDVPADSLPSIAAGASQHRHKGRKHKKRPKKNKSGGFARQMLDFHNKYRKRHCASPLQLDDKLTKQAQAYAEKLVRMDKMVHSKTKGVGENLFMMGGSAGVNLNGNEPVTDWYDEIKDYDFNNGGFSMKTGHFTQVVWKGSKRLGVGVAYSPNRKKAYVVAQYTPPGNWNDEYIKNVSPAKC